MIPVRRRRLKNTFISDQVTGVHLPWSGLSAFSGLASTYCSAYLFVSVATSCSNVSVKYNSTKSISWGLSFTLTFSPSFSLNWKFSIWTCSPTFTYSHVQVFPLATSPSLPLQASTAPPTRTLPPPLWVCTPLRLDPVNWLVCHESEHIYSQHNCHQQHVHLRVAVLLLLHHCHCHHYYQNFWLFVSWLEVYC